MKDTPKREKKPSWWQCYLICLVMAGLLVRDYWRPNAHSWTRTLAVLIIVCGYSAIAWWLRINRSTLAAEEENKQAPAREHPSAGPARDVPLSPVQAHYLRGIARYKSN